MVLSTNQSPTNKLLQTTQIQMAEGHCIKARVGLVALGAIAGVSSVFYNALGLVKTPFIALKLAARITVFKMPYVGAYLDKKLPSIEGFEYSAPFIHAYKIFGYALSILITPTLGLINPDWNFKLHAITYLAYVPAPSAKPANSIDRLKNDTLPSNPEIPNTEEGIKKSDELSEISASPEIPDSTAIPQLPTELINEILSHLSPLELARIQTVNKARKSMTPGAQIEAINKRMLPMRKALAEISLEHELALIYAPSVGNRPVVPGMSARDAVEWLIKNPCHIHLENADFAFFGDFDNECLKMLVENCPNLKHLSLENCGVSGQALKSLVHTPNLKSLNIAGCHKLEKDALKHLEHTPNLQSLNIVGCHELEEDALKHLKHATKLQSLNIARCYQLVKDALKHLTHTPNLQSLYIMCCPQLEADALKHLEHTPNLQNLDIEDCSQLEADALKHLTHTPNLQSLKLTNCRQLEADALKYLTHTPKLKSFNIKDCSQLDADAFKHLKHTLKLKKLKAYGCPQLDTEDALKLLEQHAPQLQRFSIGARSFWRP